MNKNNNPIIVCGARENNLKNIHVTIPRNKICIITGVSGAGKSSLAFDTIVSEAHRKFFFTLSHYFRQFLPIKKRAKVKKILGLSPAISLSQHETRPSVQASVATATDLNELFGVLYSKYADAFCPKHLLATKPIKLEIIADNLLKEENNQLIAICAPLVEKKKGRFEKLLENVAEKGFLRVYCNGKILPISPPPELNKEHKHTIKIVIDYLNITKTSRKRLLSSLETAQTLSQGYIDVFPCQTDGSPSKDKEKKTFSLKKGCPECGYSWPKLDSRYFSANSVGRCSACAGFGSLRQENESSLDRTCSLCEGTGISQKYKTIRLLGKNIHEIYQTPIKDLLELMKTLPQKNNAQILLLEEIKKNLNSLNQIGLSYLTPARKIGTLSLGEHQRIRLSNILSQELSGVVYVLDEPSQGLHPSELEKLLSSLKKLRDRGNTIILVDHDLYFLKNSEWLIDLGPTGGKNGGFLLSEFPPQEAYAHEKDSLTAKLLLNKKKSFISKNTSEKKPKEEPQFIEIKKASANNLKINSVSFKKNSLNLVSGVSGAGKTSLAIYTLYHNLKKNLEKTKSQKRHYDFCEKIINEKNISSCHLIDRKPLAKTSASITATYLGVFSPVRELFASLPQAKILGLAASDFSLRSGNGRCSECQGKGFHLLEMKFLENTQVECNLCMGSRYKTNVQTIKYKNKNVVDVLNMSLSEAKYFFAHHKKINKILTLCEKLGLGYLGLGQNSMSFSGGESQRLKIVPFLLKTQKENSLFIFDEPTRGLHESDIKDLKNIFEQLVSEGATLIVIEHHTGLIEEADWLIDLGPGAASEGGKLVFQGEPKNLLDSKNSITAKFISK